MRPDRTILGRHREIVLTEGDDDLNVIRVWFRPIDQSGVAYAVALSRYDLQYEIRLDKQARLLRLVSLAPSNDGSPQWRPFRRLIRFKMTARLSARARAWAVTAGEWWPNESVTAP